MKSGKQPKRTLPKAKRNLPVRLLKISIRDAETKVRLYRQERVAAAEDYEIKRNGSVALNQDPSEEEPIEIHKCGRCQQIFYNYWDWDVHTDYCDSACETEVFYYHIEKILRSISSTAHSLSIPQMSETVGQGIEADALPLDEATSYTMLAQYIKGIRYSTTTESKLRRTLHGRLECLRNSINDISNIDDPSQGLLSSGYFELAAIYSPFWVRDILSWKSGTIEDLFRFLFAVHDIPSALLNALVRYDGYDFHSLVIPWLVILGQGGNLAKASRDFPWSVSGKFQRFLLEVSQYQGAEDIGFEGLCQLAETVRLGGNQRIFTLMSRNRAFILGRRLIEPTDNWGVSDWRQDFMKFWINTVQWLSRHGSELTDSQIEELLIWGHHCYTEKQSAPSRVWAGRTTRSALAASDAYRTEIRRIESSKRVELEILRWNKKGWCASYQSDDTLWQVLELTSAFELMEEGKAMHHCVGTYHRQCMSGAFAIFSLRRNGHRLATLQVNVSDRAITQARGPYNQPIGQSTRQIVEHWAQDIFPENSGFIVE